MEDVRLIEAWSRWELHHIIQRVWERVCRVFELLFVKIRNIVFFLRMFMRSGLSCFWWYQTSGCRVSGKYSFERKLNLLMFYSRNKRGHLPQKQCFNTTIFKQFVVTNFSKERSGTIVNETLKTRILILTHTSK